MIDESTKLIVAACTGGLAGSLITLGWNLYVKRNQQMKLSYAMKYQRAFPNDLQANLQDFRVFFRDELLPDPVYLTVAIKNTCSLAIENWTIEVGARGATYVIPGWFENLPDGYSNHWTITRKDAEICSIQLTHINPGQVVKAHFILDEYPEVPPYLGCAYANLQLIKDDSLLFDGVLTP